MQYLINNKFPLAIAALLLALLLFSISPASDPVGKFFAHQSILNENAQYLKASAKQSEENVLKLAEIFALLETIQSTQIGISLIVKLQIEVGQAVAAFSNIVEQGIVVSTLSSAAAYTLLALDKIASFLSPWLFKLALLLVSIFLVCYSFSRKQYITGFSLLAAELAVILFLVAHLIIPYTIHINGWLATEVTSELTKNSQTKMTDLHAYVVDANGKKSLRKRAEHATKVLERVVIDIGKKIEIATSYAIRHIVSSIIEALIMPLVIFLALFGFMRTLVRHARTQIEELHEMKLIVAR